MIDANPLKRPTSSIINIKKTAESVWFEVTAVFPAKFGFLFEMRDLQKLWNTIELIGMRRHWEWSRGEINQDSERSKFYTPDASSNDEMKQNEGK